MKFRVLLFVLFINGIIFGQGFLKTEGQKIVNENGDNVLLKGIGLGGWLVPEGYMLNTSGFANSPTEIKNKIIELIGEENAEEYYQKYRENFVKEEDIEQIAAWGFNSIRLPMHYDLLVSRGDEETYYESGFQIIDDLLDWCENNQIYLILDLHCAPGGQSDEPISDWESNKPSLWESDQNKTKTINLWKKLAERYKDEEWIGGYDLINEPKWDLGEDNKPLKDLYVNLTNEIRKIDTNHILFIEGNWFATDFKGLFSPWDSNMVYSFHKYWNATDQGSIQYLLDIRNNYNVPLWLGESGENSNEWNKNCIKLMEEKNIGWSWWTYKKYNTISGPLSVPMTESYEQLLEYWNGSGSKPSVSYAKAALLSMTENLKLQNCKINIDYIDALFRQVQEDQSIPFKDHSIPGRIFAVDYDMGGLTIAYNDNDYQNINGSDWNNGWVYRNDGVDIESCSDKYTNGYNVGWIGSGEWLNYTVNIENPGTYDIDIRYAANSSDGYIMLQLDDYNLTSLTKIESSGGWQSWSTKTLKEIELPAGEHTLRLKFFGEGFNLNYLQFWPNTVDVGENEELNEFKLIQNYPNPFNPSTKIEFSIKEKANVELSIFDSLGRKIDVLIDENLYPGNYTSFWNATNYSTGVYFVHLKDDKGNSEIKKSILMK